MTSRMFYGAGAVLGGLAVIFSLKYEVNQDIMIFTYLIVWMIFAIGLAVEYRNMSEKWKFWSHRLCKITLLGSGLVAWFLADVMSNFLVSSSLGLPSREFGLTLKLVGVGYYILYVITIFLLAFTIMFGVATLISAILSSVAFYFPAFGKRISKIALSVVGGFAAIQMMGVLWTVPVSYVEHVYSRSENKVRWLAYQLDYSYLEEIPCIEKDKKSIIHAGGIVSYATMDQDGNVSIVAEPLDLSCER